MSGIKLASNEMLGKNSSGEQVKLSFSKIKKAEGCLGHCEITMINFFLRK